MEEVWGKRVLHVSTQSPAPNPLLLDFPSGFVAQTCWIKSLAGGDGFNLQPLSLPAGVGEGRKVPALRSFQSHLINITKDNILSLLEITSFRSCLTETETNTTYIFPVKCRITSIQQGETHDIWTPIKKNQVCKGE